MSVRPTAPDRAAIRRQISLPLAKAVEIAWKNITVRLSRSLVVTGGIVLALAFLMAVLTGEAMLRAMAGWAQRYNARQSEEYRGILARRSAVEARSAAAQAALRQAAESVLLHAAVPQVSPQQRASGIDLAAVARELRNLPAPADRLAAALAAHPALVATMKQWVEDQRELNGLVRLLGRADELKARMQAAGADVDAAGDRQRRVRTRWVAGLALLVAFVGILNAMLMSVSERFREIGTMKCLGALDGFIVKLFLIESLFHGVAGTAAGVLAGFALAAGGMYLTYGEYAWIDFPLGAVLRAAGTCMLTGVLLTVGAAVLPAWQAARMQPVEAMRAET